MSKLTYQQKLEALSYRFYQHGQWTPKAGDFYTTSRADLELYQVVSVDDGIVRTRYTEDSTTISEWPESEFLTEGFGPKRVFVPDWVLFAPRAAVAPTQPPPVEAPAPQTTEPWGWYASADAEIYTIGPLQSRDAIIAEAQGQQLGAFTTEDGIPALDFYIVEACNEPLRLADWIDVESLLDAADEAVYDSDRVSEDALGPFFEHTPEDRQDLKARITAACDAWQAERGLVFKVNSFKDTRNEAHITIAVENDEAQP